MDKSLPDLAMASGKRCKNAPPIREPAEKETKTRISFFKSFSFKTKTIKPIQANKLIPNPLKIIQIKVCIIYIKNRVLIIRLALNYRTYYLFLQIFFFAIYYIQDTKY